MNYLDSVKSLREIEKSYDVMSIKFMGISIWPYLRIYLFDSMQDSQRSQGYSGSNVKKVLFSMFFYNWFVLCKKFDTWIIGDTVDRKKVNGMYQQSITGNFHKTGLNFLQMERPGNKPYHYKKKQIFEKNIISFSILLFFAHLFEVLRRLQKIQVENEDIIIKIMQDYSPSFNYEYYLRYFASLYSVTSMMLRITHVPKKIFVICPYTIMGSILAFKKKGIRIIEMQHGVINKNHFAYNGFFHSDELQPDEICVFGEEEYELFSSSRSSYCKVIHKTGLFILDESKKNFVNDIFLEQRAKYKKIVVLAGQVATDSAFLDFIAIVAKNFPEMLFIYIPRNIPNQQITFDASNIICRAGVNIYEYLKWCDIHCTVSSTTCLEAHYFKKPTIFFNLGKIAENYYHSLLVKENGAFYVNDVDEFSKSVKEIESGIFVFKSLYSENGLQTLKRIVESDREGL